MNALREAAKVSNDESLMNSINRVFNIWQERSIYPKEFIDELKGLLCGEKLKSEVMSKIISDFSVNDVINQINNITRISQFTKIKYQALSNRKLEFSNSDLFNKLKDKSYGEQFKKELDDAEKSLQTVISAYEKEIAERKQELTALEKANIYYLIQMKETEKIAESFKNCELVLEQVQNLLASRGYNFSSPITTTFDTSQQSMNYISQSNNSSVSSLDQRLTSLMSGAGHFNLNETNYNQIKNPNSLPMADPYLSNPNEVNQIESVITTRPYQKENPSENFEPADMDLGDSEDEDRQLNYFDAQKPMSQVFIPGQDISIMMPMMQQSTTSSGAYMQPSLDDPTTSTIDNEKYQISSNVLNLQPSVDLNVLQGDSIRSLSSTNRSHRNQTYHSPNYNNNNQWRNLSNDNRHSRHQNYNNLNSSRQSSSRWKNGSNSSWKRTSYEH